MNYASILLRIILKYSTFNRISEKEKKSGKKLNLVDVLHLIYSRCGHLLVNHAAVNVQIFFSLVYPDRRAKRARFRLSDNNRSRCFYLQFDKRYLRPLISETSRYESLAGCGGRGDTEINCARTPMSGNLAPDYRCRYRLVRDVRPD